MISRKLVQHPSIPPKFRSSLQYCTLKPPAHFNPPFLPKSPSILATNVIKSYFDSGLITEARSLFDEMPERDVVAWSAMISGYISCNHHARAWRMFGEMLRDGAYVQPNEFTFSSVLKACKGMNSLPCGTLAHALALKHGVLGNLYVGNALMDMYAACSVYIDQACLVFEEIGAKNSVSWTTMIAGYTHLGDGHGALRVFRQMLLVCTSFSNYSADFMPVTDQALKKVVQSNKPHSVCSTGYAMRTEPGFWLGVVESLRK